MHLVGQRGKAHVLLVILPRAEGTWDRDTTSPLPTLENPPIPTPKGIPRVGVPGDEAMPARNLCVHKMGTSSMRSPSPHMCVPPLPHRHILHLGGVVGVQLPPGAPRAVGAGGRGSGDVLLEIRGPRAGEDPGVPLITSFVWSDPARAAQEVAGLPPALWSLHLPGAVSWWAIPKELGQLSLLRVLLQETLYLGSKGGGDTGGGNASLRWQHPAQPHKP